MKVVSFGFLKDQMWLKVTSLLVVLFFILLSDAILSDWVPAYMQGVLGGSLMMGLVMSFSSVVGFSADLVFPQLLKKTGVKKLLTSAILLGLLFSICLMVVIYKPSLLVLLLAMAIWGIYYEFLGFANQQFVVDVVESHHRTKVWAVIGVFRNLAYFVGPILGGVMAVKGDWLVVAVAAGISIIAYIFFYLMKISEKRIEVETEKVNILKEMSHWWVLLEHVWPMIIISLILGLIDATFWTTGTVVNDNLAKVNPLGSFFLSAYTLPSLFVGFLVMRWGIYKKKKKWAEFFMALGGFFLVMLHFNDGVYWQLLMVFFSSLMLSVAYPLVDAVYSDIISRMGRERKHMMGLGSSTVSLAYIIGPVIAGGIASVVGERQTFVTMGVLTVVVAVFLMMVTPRKLKLPRKEILGWE